MAVGEEVGWKCDAILAASKGLDKVGRRKVRAQYIEDRVREGYAAIGGLRV
jgi:hypothetical protein